MLSASQSLEKAGVFSATLQSISHLPPRQTDSQEPRHNHCAKPSPFSFQKSIFS